ncbi:Uncharacterized protein APZ42_004915 [Daphnia magna]|uniref:Uncharacterized protein n=1 Tax=Daphnia magna TaxID=35525 RepID=A0A164GRS6_9CRUS|nr:Uncharacterized protein APZ42_004915 [Daphnia magna]
MAKADGNEPICHVLGFSSSLKWDNNNKKKVNVEMAEINSTFFCFFFFRVFWFVSKQQCDLSPLAGGWRANTPLFHILTPTHTHAGLLCVKRTKKTLNHLSTPPSLLLLRFSSLSLSLSAHLSLQRRPMAPTLPGRKCGKQQPNNRPNHFGCFIACGQIF